MRAAYTALLLAGLTAPAMSPAWAGEMTLKHVLLSSGGVGYFEYGGEVEGTESVGLDVPLAAVDDVLKSLVVFDPSGAVAGVELPGRDDTVQAFADAPFGPEALQSPAAYLNALRGTDVTVRGAHPMTGRIVRAETVTETVDTIAMPRTRVTILGGDGLRQFLLEEAEGVQVTDPALRDRIDRALESLRRDANASTRHLTIRFSGKGTRNVAVGYVAGAPLWKATYRLVMPASPGPNARLQGWATLENQSGVDWKDVTLTLQYGNPVTFRQALYKSYFVQRQEVPVEILGRVPAVMDTRAIPMPAAVSQMAPPPAAPAPMPAPFAKSRAMMAPAQEIAAPANAAVTEETGDETNFTLTQTLDLTAGHTANVPILDRPLSAGRVGVVSTDSKHPLSAIRLRNDAGQSLPAGVLTLYDSTGGLSFAGDARLSGLSAGETRLLYFARDLRTAVDTKDTPAPDTITAVTAAEGILTITSRVRHGYHFDLVAPAKEARDLILEIPRSGPSQTVSFEDSKTRVTEQTATAFRAAVTLAAGETRTVVAWVDEPVRQSVAVLDGDDGFLRVIATTGHLPPATQTALRHILDLRQDLARKQAEAARQKKLMTEVEADETRIRQNLAALSPTDGLRARMTRALEEDETKIDQIRKASDDAEAEVAKAHRALSDAAGSLKI